MIAVTVKFDTTKLSEGLAYAMRWTKRTPAELVNTAACEIAIVAKNSMPFVTAQKIDFELGTISTPKLGKRGQVLQQFSKKGKSIAKNKTYSGGRMGKYPATAEVPLAVLIIVARAKPGSNYNLTTGGRYALAQNPFKGFSRELGAFKMATLIDNMIKARHRSGHFLMAGWIPAVRALLPYSVNRWRRGSGAASGPPMEGQSSYYGRELGSADIADPNSASTTAVAIITNNIGFEGKNAANFNKALWEHGAGPLQRAIDGEGGAAFQYALDKATEEMAAGVNKSWK